MKSSIILASTRNLEKVPKTQTHGTKFLIHINRRIGANEGFEHASCKSDWRSGQASVNWKS